MLAFRGRCKNFFGHGMEELTELNFHAFSTEILCSLKLIFMEQCYLIG